MYFQILLDLVFDFDFDFDFVFDPELNRIINKFKIDKMTDYERIMELIANPNFWDGINATANKISKTSKKTNKKSKKSKSSSKETEPKTIWMVHHQHNEGIFNWSCAFSSEELAEDLLEEMLDKYHSQDTLITKDDDGNFYIQKDEDATPVVRMYMEPVLLDCPEYGTVIL